MNGRAPRVEVQRTGVLLAAGRGRRAGGSKQLLPVVTAGGIVPLVAASFDAVAGVCAAMVVVLGHEPEAVKAALGARGFHAVESDPDGPMSESIRAGLRAALAIDLERSMFLHLGDHPWVRAGTLARVVREGARRPERAIMPEFRGRGGHPVLIPALMARVIVGTALPGGLRRFWSGRPEWCVRLGVDDPGVVRDVDRIG